MKKIKILFWKLLEWINEVNIKMSENDLKIFEKRSLVIEKHLKKLDAIDNSDLDNFDEDMDLSNYTKGFSGGHTVIDPKGLLNKKFGVDKDE